MVRRPLSDGEKKQELLVNGAAPPLVSGGSSGNLSEQEQSRANRNEKKRGDASHCDLDGEGMVCRRYGNCELVEKSV